MEIRDASVDDAAALLEIYAPYITDSSVSFEIAVPTREEFGTRIRQALATHAWLVAEEDEKILGYAYSSAHRGRAAYRFAVEVSAYVQPLQHGRGVGRRLYECLFERLRARGYHRAYGGITLPNDPSVAFHKSLGFEQVGVYRRIGFKSGRWHDVAWWQYSLREGDPDES